MKRPPLPAPRQMALIGALAFSVVAAAWVSHTDEADLARPAPRRGAEAAPALSSAQPLRESSHANRPERSGWPGASTASRGAWPPADPQATASWGEAAPDSAASEPTAVTDKPAELPTPPAPPAAPPFPYQLVGRMTDSRPRAILNNAQRSAVVGVGDVVDADWRVDAIDASGLSLTYLPLGLTQFIPFVAAA